MPTAGKLAGAVLFAALAYVLADLYVQRLPPGTAVGQMRLWCALIGLGCGWGVMGPQARAGFAGLVNAGLQTVVAMVLLALLLSGVTGMFDAAYRRLYDGPVEALIGMLGLMAGQARLLADPVLAGVMLGGGALGGVLTGMVGRRWS